MRYLSKPASNGESAPLGAPRPSGEWPVLYPALLEFCTCHVWDDGTARVVGTLTLFTDAGQWKLCLNDKDSGRTAFVTGETAEDVFARAEAGLVASSLDWRASRPGPGGKRRN